MKKKLNILCLLVMLVLGLSLFESFYYIGNAFVEGVRVGLQKAAKERVVDEKLDPLSWKDVALFPSDLSVVKDSVYNEKSRSYVPVSYSGVAVNITTPSNSWFSFLNMFCPFINGVAMIFSIFLFIRLIVAINKSDIFIWKNVSRLRKLGVALIIGFVSSFIPACITAYELSGVFSMHGYSVMPFQLVSSLTLVLGLVSLIVAEVFAIGLRLQEEQDLTI